jgi:hypothetical protein
MAIGLFKKTVAAPVSKKKTLGQAAPARAPVLAPGRLPGLPDQRVVLGDEPTPIQAPLKDHWSLFFAPGEKSELIEFFPRPIAWPLESGHEVPMLANEFAITLFESSAQKYFRLFKMSIALVNNQFELIAALNYKAAIRKDGSNERPPYDDLINGSYIMWNPHANVGQVNQMENCFYFAQGKKFELVFKQYGDGLNAPIYALLRILAWAE